jgi:hypothetical protein
MENKKFYFCVKYDVMIRFLSFVMLILIGFSACTSNSGQEKSIEEIKADGKISNSDIIRNPVTADENVDTVNVAKMTFAESSFDFGEVKQGDVVEHTFTFTNTGKVPLLVSGARSTCGCTVPEWPEELIDPGKTGEILVKFDTKGKSNKQSKPVTISANTYPSTTRVTLNGYVRVTDTTQ